MVVANIAQYRATHWPEILFHGLTKIRMILAEDRLANIGRTNIAGRQSYGEVGPRSEILAEDRPANIDRYIGRPIMSHGWADQDQRYWQKTGQPTQIDTLAGQHRSIQWPANLGPWLDQDQK